MCKWNVLIIKPLDPCHIRNLNQIQKGKMKQMQFNWLGIKCQTYNLLICCYVNGNINDTYTIHSLEVKFYKLFVAACFTVDSMLIDSSNIMFTWTILCSKKNPRYLLQFAEQQLKILVTFLNSLRLCSSTTNSPSMYL